MMPVSAEHMNAVGCGERGLRVTRVPRYAKPNGEYGYLGLQRRMANKTHQS